MNSALRFLPLLLAAASFLAAEPAAGTIKFPGHGFEIRALETGGDTGPSFTPLMMALPARDGFAPNINVNIQAYDGTIAAYVALTKNQFAQAEITLVEEKSVGDHEWRIEYSGKVRGAALHWYARAIARDGRVYLVTATATETQWAEVATLLRDGVDSFKLTP